MCLAGKVPPGHVPNYLYVRLQFMTQNETFEKHPMKCASCGTGLSSKRKEIKPLMIRMAPIIGGGLSAIAVGILFYIKVKYGFGGMKILSYLVAGAIMIISIAIMRAYPAKYVIKCPKCKTVVRYRIQSAV